MKLGALSALLLLTVTGRAGAPARPIVFAADRAPEVSGEIYRLDLATGRHVDLSRSPFQDTDPVVSPDGKRVAFLSTLGPNGGSYVYVVGIDGRGLVRVSSRLSSGQEPDTAWSPDSAELAVVAEVSESPLTLGMYLIRPGRSQVLAVHSQTVGRPAWAPDGRAVLVADEVGVHAVSSSGHELWEAASIQYAWSARGLAAVSAAGEVSIRTETGGTVASFPGRNFAWSPDGSRIAVVRGEHVDLRDAAGRLLANWALPGLVWSPDHTLVWLDADRVVVNELRYATAVAIDMRTGKRSTAPPTAFDVHSPDGKLVVENTYARNAFVVRIARPDGSHARTALTVRGCLDDGDSTGAANVQFTPDDRSLVYESHCPEAYDNLYAAGANGGVRRLTTADAQQTDPVLSPDGTKLAYLGAVATGLSCKGCPTTLWVANADGSHARELTHLPFCTFDDRPSWSPDSAALLVDRSNCSTSTFKLLEIRAAGGPVTTLPVTGGQPAWGPQKIAYVVHEQSLWTAAPDGSGATRIFAAARGLAPLAPAWSPDGRLAYLVQDYRYGNYYLVVGSRRVRLPFRSATSLAWSPDGTRLVVAAKALGTASPDVYTLRPDGTGIRRITENLDASSASWG